jgi:hypothetical protein
MKNTWVFLVCFVFSAFALFGQNADDFETEIEDGAVTITRYTGTVKDVRIPDKINGLPVTAIGGYFVWDEDEYYGAFAGNDLTSVTIPNSVTSIGDSTFAENQLVSVTIGNSVTSIGWNAFSSNELTSVTIPNSVISIGEDAFDSGVNVVQNGRVVYGIQEGFSYTLMNGTINIWNYTGTAKDVRIPDKINGLPVTAIGGYSDWGDYYGAFTYNDLTSVTIPNSVTSIGESAFDSGVNVVQNGRVVYGIQEGFSYTLSDGTLSIWNYTGTAKYIRIPDRINNLPVTSIGGYNERGEGYHGAFFSKDLTSVTIPNSVTSIGVTVHATTYSAIYL